MSNTDESSGDWYCPTCQAHLDPSRVTYAEMCDTCHTPVIWDSDDAPRSVEDLLAENARLQSVVTRLRAAALTQAGWEANEDRVLLNGKPVGGTITKHRREFGRWWPAVKRALLCDASEPAGKDRT